MREALQRPAPAWFSSYLPRQIRDWRLYVLDIRFADGQFRGMASYTTKEVGSFFGDGGWTWNGKEWMVPYYFRYDNPALFEVLERLRESADGASASTSPEAVAGQP